MTLQLSKPSNHELQDYQFDQDRIELIKRIFCKGATDEELQLFIHACQRSGLDPFMRQIFAVKRWDSSQRREVMSIQTGIDGYRLIADRTGRYSPGRDTEYGYDENGSLKWAKAYVNKMTPDGKWHEVSATAYWDEYVQTTKDGKITAFWQKKAHIMLGKCAEAAALRRGFPAELSGIYTQEEMGQEISSCPSSPKKIETISEEQAEELTVLVGADQKFHSDLLNRLKHAFGCESFADLPLDQFENVKRVINEHNLEKQTVEV